MARSFDVIVVGVGAMGAATCDQLALRGVSVLGLERFSIPHPHGSSGGHTRLIRLAYFEHPDYVPLLRRAYAGWDELEERTGQTILHRTGCLFLGPPDRALVRGTLAAATEHRLACEQLDRRELSGLGPFRVPERFAALFEPDAGLLLCERAISSLAVEATRAGAVLHQDERVREWSADGGGVRVRTERGEYVAGKLIVTAGAWTPELVRDLGVRLVVSRQVMAWVWPPQPEHFEIGRFPCWAIEDDEPGFSGLYYGFPLLPEEQFGGERGIKLGHHYIGPVADPDSVDRDATPADEEDFRRGLRKYLPAADGPTVTSKVCLYTNSPDQHFVVGRHPAHDTVTLACGFSGHGFKFAPVIGEALADLVTSGESALPIAFLGLDRFAIGDPLSGGRDAGGGRPA